MNNEFDYEALNIDPDILKKAWDGDADSQIFLGKAHLNVVYTGGNCSNAFEWIHRSAEQGNMEAQYRLGNLFALGQGTSKSYTEAYEWYTKAALQGYKKALIRIFNLYQQDKKMHCRGKLDSGETRWCKKSLLKTNNARELNEYRLKHHESKLNYAIAYYTKLFNMLKSGDQEDSNISLKLGFLYQCGYGVKKCIKLAIDYYTVAASQGNRDAQYHLGYLYKSDTDIKFNYYHALRWYRISAKNGNVAAQNALGYFYEKGFATELNFEGAIHWYTKAANSGNSDAQLTLGKLYRKGDGADVDISQAIQWYTLAANQGNGAAQNCLNQLYRNSKTSQLSDTTNNTGYDGKHRTKPTFRSKLQDDIEELENSPHVNQLKKLAEHALRTDGNAMFTLGMNYYNGEDFNQDKEAGFQWIKRAAKAGLQKAELKVAEMYKTGGDVVEQDYHESSIWTTKLVKQRNDVAQCTLGLLYLSGKGVRKDPLEASKWFTKSADQGNAEAQYQLGLLRLKGLGLRTDGEEAVEWFHKSALNGNKDALYELGKVYNVGEHAEGDTDKAIKFYEYSAKHGNPDSQIKLAEMYEKGWSVDQDLQKAEQYLQLSKNSLKCYETFDLAKRYLYGDFGNSDYTKAFELFKKIGDEDPSSGYNIFATSSSWPSIINPTKVVDMLKLFSEQGEQGIHYTIGYVYENKVYSGHSKVLFHTSLTNAIHWYAVAATKGDSRAKWRLGIMYEEGKGVDIDLAMALNYYSEANEAGISDATYRLALMYMNGNGVTQNLVKAYCLFTEISNKGHKEAFKKLIPSEISDNLKMLEAVANAGYVAVQYQLGVFYQDKKKHTKKAMQWLALASDSGVTDASYRLGVIYEELKGNDQSFSEAIHLYSEAIKQDHEEAMYRLARIYHLGKGVECDYQKAYDLYSRAAELGHNDSSRLLDITNYSINQHSEDVKNSLSIIKFMARKGNMDLQYILGIFYMTKKSHLDYNEAFKWYQMAASNDHVDAIYQLGLLYENGQGTTQDYSMAFRLHNQVKEKGHPESIYRLGIAYHYGRGVAANNSEAIDCYTEAAKLGSNQSQYKLGKLYGAGELVGKDLLKTLEWYTKAYLNGNLDVINDLYQLYDEKPLELYFYRRLFRILYKTENAYDPENNFYNQIYGSLCLKLGTMYLNGQGTTEDLPVALKHFLKAYYDFRYQDAEPFLSLGYNQHGASSQSIYLAKLEAYLQIQDQIPNKHLYKLGMVYYNGVHHIFIDQNISSNLGIATILASDYSMALRYFNQASLTYNSDAQYQLGLMYLRGHGVKKDYQKALELFTAASDSLTFKEKFSRGIDFYEGRGVEKDDEIATIYFQKAGIQDTKVQAYLVPMHLDKLEKEQQESKAIEKEIENMEPDLLYNRGVQLYRGSSEGVKNYGLSSLYIRTAAEKNHNQAMAQLGKMYLDGVAFEKNENEAMKWIQKSIKVMDPKECYEQGMVFYNEKNYEISFLYMEKGAENNNDDAQAHIGLMYLCGLGVVKNHEQAMTWFRKSAMQFYSDNCHEKAMKFYERVDLDNNYEIALLYLKKAADEYDSSAQAQLGVMYLQGFGVGKNYNIAMEWIELSVKRMWMHDCYDFGLVFYNGIEVEKNYDIELLFIQKAADQNFELAQAHLGLMYLDGHGVSENEHEAMKCIEKSLKNMNYQHCYDLGFHLYNRYESEKHLRIAWVFISKAAEKGDGLAQALLGEMYLEEKGAQKSQGEALKWIEKSVNNLEPYECYSQGMKYYNGVDVETNYNIAMFYLQAAYLKKYTLAQVQIGIMYLEGQGVEKSKEKAMECFQQSINEINYDECYRQGMVFYNEYSYDISLFYIRKAAGAGYSIAQFQLGIMLLEGKGIQKNQPEALNWIAKSLESMTPNNCYDQGMALYRGTTVVKDYALSFRFMEKAAEKHHGLAQAQLGLAYLYGLGVVKNKDEAMKWVEQSMKELNADEYYEQGMKLYNETEIDLDYEMTLLYIQEATEHHHGLSQAQLALMHLEGRGVVKNYDTAMYWIEKSMNEMKLTECYRQGMIFYNRTELENNYDIALRYFKKASKANAYAQAQLGYMYLNGIGVDQDHEEAARWHGMVENNYIGHSRYCRSKIYHYDQGGMQDFSKALKLYQEELRFMECDYDYDDFYYSYYYVKSVGCCDAMRGIGLLYEYGDGVTQDSKKALKYYGRSALDKNTAAYYDIGLLYYYGKGVDQNYKEAFIYFTKLANSIPDPEKLHVFIEENNDDAKDMTGSSKRAYSLLPEGRIYGEAHYYIGLMYNNGFFVDQDEERARNYFKMAYVHGVERAKNLLK